MRGGRKSGRVIIALDKENKGGGSRTKILRPEGGDKIPGVGRQKEDLKYSMGRMIPSYI